GLLARAAWPATVVTLALSDVIGDPLDVIASGPTAPDPTTFATALEVLERHGVRDRVPASVRERLDAGIRGEIEETPKPGDRVFSRVTNLVIGNNTLITDAAVATAQQLGFRTCFLSREIQGEAREVARELVGSARPRGGGRSGEGARGQRRVPVPPSERRPARLRTDEHESARPLRPAAVIVL